ncbi:MAG: hypothetical protein C0594_00805 [Marinilabiliales bacterium]|nr:MAG: hypothetical protein C0594_00805 [Marinilabiliales bacterium]
MIKRLDIMKKLSIISAILLGMFVFTSCENCQSCRQVTYDEEGSVYSDSNTPQEYCDDELTTIEEEEPVEVGGMSNEWVCE